jgi:hypothetical protein
MIGQFLRPIAGNKKSHGEIGQKQTVARFLLKSP